MANLKEQEKWEDGIYQIEENDPVLGGADGITNKPIIQLANRTTWLKKALELLTGKSKPKDLTADSASEADKDGHSHALAPYFSYSESFIPETAQYKPTEGRQYEVGIKYLPSFIDGTFSVAYYDLKQDNAFTPTQGGLAWQIEHLRSKGVEVAADFNVTDTTHLSLAYSYNDANEYRANGDKFRPPIIPTHTASAQITQQLGDGIIIGAAVRYIGTSENGSTDKIKSPAKTLADLMFKYRFAPNWELQANVSNLTDEEYVTGCFSSVCYYGEGRQISANLTYKW
ncbi:TonB-dependent receptor [[Pasteurella] aerogenes]|nr:TonB-dependent receptor [[Pasteurella] aerogenes]